MCVDFMYFSRKNTFLFYFLDDYMALHEGIRDFKCDKCEYAFGQATDLKQHIKRFHEENQKFKKHKCNFIMCEKAFVSAFQLKKHIESVHVMEGEVIEIKQEPLEMLLE